MSRADKRGGRTDGCRGHRRRAGRARPGRGDLTRGSPDDGLRAKQPRRRPRAVVRPVRSSSRPGVAHPGHQSGRPRVPRRAAPWRHARGPAAPRGRDRRNLLRVPVPAGQRLDQERRANPGPARRRVRTGVAAPRRCRRVGRGLDRGPLRLGVPRPVLPSVHREALGRPGVAGRRAARPRHHRQRQRHLVRRLVGATREASSPRALRPRPEGDVHLPRPGHRRDLRSARRSCGGCGRHDPHQRAGLRGRPRGRPGRRCRHPRGRQRAPPRPRGRSRPRPGAAGAHGRCVGLESASHPSDHRGVRRGRG